MAALKYTKDHEAVYVEGDIAWVGITPYAKDALGDLVFVDLPAPGKTVSQKQSVAVVESVKTAADVYSPVDGEVVEANTKMPDDLEMIGLPLKDGGWIAKIKMSNPGQIAGLMDEAAYQGYLKTLS